MMRTCNFEDSISEFGEQGLIPRLVISPCISSIRVLDRTKKSGFTLSVSTQNDSGIACDVCKGLDEPIPTGRIAGWKLAPKDWDALIDEYYEMHNWDKETSFPTRKCLEDLDPKSGADDFEKIGKLGKTEEIYED